MQPIPVAASVALARLVAGVPRPVRPVAGTPLAFYLATGDPELPAVCVCTPEAVRVPCALVLGPGVPLPELPAMPGRIGGGRLVLGGFEARVARWWRPPRPRAVCPPPAQPAVPGAGAVSELVAALVAGQPLAPPVRALVGRGPGLTPLGDDILAGLLVALRALECPATPRLAEVVCRIAPGRTTLVSVALLRHAARGECIPELAAVLRGEPGADRALLRVGHSSGDGLAQGIRAGYAVAGQLAVPA